MDFLIVTGMSGSGKTVAINELEDLGYFCVDNIPSKLAPQLAQLCSESSVTTRIAMVMDFRSRDIFGDFTKELQNLMEQGHSYRVLMIEADERVILRRYKENRRRHPMMDSETHGGLEEAIAEEKKLLEGIRATADYIIDTSLLTTSQLRDRIESLFAIEAQSKLTISCMSFGYKYGIPSECDLVLDVRCLPNPFYIPELKEKTGMDLEVQSYVMSFEQSRVLFGKFSDLLKFLLPLYIEEGKCNLVVAFGCTGGRHRSVTFAEKMNKALLAEGYRVSAHHRDVARQK